MRYDVKCWVTVEATDENDAVEQANRYLEMLPVNASAEGEGSVYEVDDDA